MATSTLGRVNVGTGTLPPLTGPKKPVPIFNIEDLENPAPQPAAQAPAPAAAPVATAGAETKAYTDAEIGARVKAKNPSLSSFTDEQVGARIREKNPDMFGAAPEAPAPEPSGLAKAAGVVGNIAKAIVKPIASTAVQMPRAFGAGIAGLAGNEELEAKWSKPVNVPLLGEVKGLSANPDDAKRYGTKTGLQTAGQAAEIASLLVGGGAAKEGVKQVGTGALKEAVKTGAKQGALAGGLSGFGVSAGEEGASNGRILKSTLGGAALGGALGAALPVAAEGVRRGVDATKRGFQKVGEMTDDVATRAKSAFGKPSLSSADETKLLSEGTPDARVATKSLQGEKVVTDKAAAEVVRQGIPEPDVALIKSGSRVDKEKMLKMLDIREKQLTNKRITERATDVVGDTFVEKVAKPVEQLNREAGKKLNAVAQGLAGKKVDVADAVVGFSDDLERAGVKVRADGSLNFKGSDFEGLSGPQKLIQNAWTRALRVAKTGDALQAHRAKSYIDEIVNYGKQTEGLSGKSQSILKGFRHDIDSILDVNFPTYNKVNTQYSETIQQLDRLGAALGKSFKIGDTFADAQAGVSMRRVLSNTQSRSEILRMLDGMQAVLKKNGIKLDDDVITQANFADVLERMLGSEAPNSFLGQGEKLLGQTEKVVGAGTDLMRGNVVSGTIKAGKYMLDVTRGVSQENQIKALRALLMRDLPKAVSNIGRKALK